jgi:PAS domain-containing protein
MPKYTINGVTYNSPTALSDADLEELTGGAPETPKAGILDFLPKGIPSWAQSKPGQGWDDANAQAAGGDPTNPMAYLSEAQKTEQGRVGKAIGQGVQVGVREGTQFAKGAVINPILAAGQLVAPEAVQNVQEQMATMRQNAGGEGFSPTELIGSIVSPVNRLLPGGGYAGGAVGAVMQPLEGKDLTTWDILTGKATQALGGALMGRFAENVIAGLTPKLKEGAAELITKGIPVSPGQAYEGAPGWLFRQMESLGLGPKAETINKAFNPVVANEVLSTIDQTVPKTVKPGQQSVAYAQNRISKFYDDSLAKLGTNPFDSEYKQGMGAILKAAAQDIPDEKTRKVLVNSLNANIGHRVEKNGISGEKIKDLQEWLKGQVTKYDGATGINEIGLKTAYSDALANLNQFVSRIDVDGNIAKADSAWAKLYGFADASKRATTKGGVFNPEQLSQAVVAQAPTTLVAGGGKAPMNELAQTAVNVLGKQEPATGLGKLMLASKVATGFATAWAAPMVAIPILTASGLTYAAAKQLMKDPSATRIAIKKALEKNPGLFGTAGTNIYNQITSEDAAVTP